jgi:two-component system response regulator HydG
VRLLRFLQGGEIRRIGDTVTRRVDVRLVAATHRSLDREVAAGRFREDFYYRINVIGIHIPPLRERPDDIPVLAMRFLRRAGPRLRGDVPAISPGAMAMLCRYGWPGNVRELENAIERALNVASGPMIVEADLPSAVALSSAAHTPELGAPGSADARERDRLIAALTDCRWNQGRAAEVLGISRTTLWRKLRQHGIEV